MTASSPHRSQVPTHQTWDLGALYPDQDSWNQEASRLQELIEQAPALTGTLQESPEQLLACLRLQDEADQLVSRLTCFAECRKDEDVTDPERQALFARAQRLASQTQAAFAFVQTEIQALPPAFLAAPPLSAYRRFLQHTRQTQRLTPEVASVLASLQGLLAEPRTIWQQTLFGDLTPKPITDALGTECPVTLQNFGGYLRSSDRMVRQAAYNSINQACLSHKHSLTAAIVAAQRRDVTLARLKGYPTALHAALDVHELPTALIDGLTQGALRAAPQLQRYLAWRAERLGVAKVAPYDLGAPVTAAQNQHVTWDEAWEILLAALAPLGPEYRRLLERARAERWCDWAQHQHKSYVPYSRDTYGCHPFINLPWNGTAQDLSTLAHELGHAIHTVLAQGAQPYRDSKYGGLLAESAATTNQMLLSEYLIRTAPAPQLREAYAEDALQVVLVNFFYAAVLTQLQVEMHAAVEREVPLSFKRITAIWMDLLSRCYGDGYEITAEGVGSQWLRVPQHFANFYSYQYVGGTAAGVLFAHALSAGGEADRERYLSLLKAGASKPPLTLLQEAGLDMTNPDAIASVGDYFGSLMDGLSSTRREET